jgi:hypothetical protein
VLGIQYPTDLKIDLGLTVGSLLGHWFLLWLG